MPKVVARITIPCSNPDCGKSFEIRPKLAATRKNNYCSWECKCKGQVKPRTTLRCAWCNGKFKVWPSDLDRKYCSVTCDHKSRAGRTYLVHRKVAVKRRPEQAVETHREALRPGNAPKGNAALDPKRNLQSSSPLPHLSSRGSAT